MQEFYQCELLIADGDKEGFSFDNLVRIVEGFELFNQLPENEYFSISSILYNVEKYRLNFFIIIPQDYDNQTNLFNSLITLIQGQIQSPAGSQAAKPPMKVRTETVDYMECFKHLKSLLHEDNGLLSTDDLKNFIGNGSLSYSDFEFEYNSESKQ